MTSLTVALMFVTRGVGHRPGFFEAVVRKCGTTMETRVPKQSFSASIQETNALPNIARQGRWMIGCTTPDTTLMRNTGH